MCSIMKNGAFLLMVISLALLSGSAGAESPQLKAHRIDISYVNPKNPAHQQIYVMVKEYRLLERFQDYLGHMRLPATLLLKMEGCDGTANAWYESSDHSVTVCYEYLEELRKNAPDKTTPGGVTSQDAVYGPTVEVFLHEISHALFDMLKIPILGREEDAADLLAAYTMLNMDKDLARKSVSGVAYMYGREARSQNVKLEQFAGVHGITAQRLYNLLCIAYGSDIKLFADLVEKGWLPNTRAETCTDEYRQIEYASTTLFRQYTEEAVKRKVDRKKLLRPAAPN